MVATVAVACDTFAPVKKADAPKRLNFTEDLSLYGDVEALYITTYNNNANSESYGDVNSKEIYRFDERGSVVEYSSFSGDGALYNRVSYVYDANDNVVEKRGYNKYYPDLNGKSIYVYDSNNKLLKETGYGRYGKLAFRRNYKYDACGNLVKDSMYDYNLKAGEVTVYKYNAKGQLIEEIFEYDDYEGRNAYADGSFPILYTIYKYDSAGRLIETAGYDSTTCANLGYLHQLRYDSMGNLIESDVASYCYGDELSCRTVSIYSQDANNVLLETRCVWGSTTYLYDSVNNLTEEVSYDKSGAISSRVVYTYDAFGNNIEMARYSEDNTLTSKSLYSYDDRGNMIEKTNDHTRVVYEISYRTQPAQVE